MNDFFNLYIGGGVTLHVYKNVDKDGDFCEVGVSAVANGVTTPIALVGRSSADKGDAIHTYAYNDMDDEPVETHINVGWDPVKYDPKRVDKFESGLYYDGDLIFSIRDYDDEEVDYDAGCVGCLVMFFNPKTGAMFDDALYTGYHSTNECMEDLWHTDNVWRIYPDGFDAAYLTEIEQWFEDEGINLREVMAKVDRLVERA